MPELVHDAIPRDVQLENTVDDRTGLDGAPHGQLEAIVTWIAFDREPREFLWQRLTSSPRVVTTEISRHNCEQEVARNTCG